MRKHLCLVLALALCLVTFTGCSGGTQGGAEGSANPSQSSGPAAKPVRVGLLLPGEVSDGGWNANAYSGLMRMKDELGADVNYMENVKQSDMQEAMRNYAVDGYDFVICHGDQFSDSALAVAPEFPDTKFIINSASIGQSPNVASCSTDNKQQGFLAGVFAAKMSKSGVIGGIISIEISSLLAFMEGAELGIKYVNPDLEFTSVCVGSSTDVGKAKELSKALMDQGADILLPYASQCDNGAYEAAKEAGDVLCVGVITDRYELAPDQIPVSIRCSIGDANFDLVAGISAGTTEWKADVYSMGIPEGTVGYFDLQGKWADEIPADVWEYCKKVESAFIDGTLDITDVDPSQASTLPSV